MIEDIKTSLPMLPLMGQSFTVRGQLGLLVGFVVRACSDMMALNIEIEERRASSDYERGIQRKQTLQIN